MIRTRYKKPLIILIITISLISIMIGFLSISMANTGFLAFSPIENGGFDVFLVSIIAWISALIGGIIPGYILAPLLLVIQKYTIGLRIIYPISKMEVFPRLSFREKTLSIPIFLYLIK